MLLWSICLRADAAQNASQDTYPRSYSDIVNAAKSEKELIIYNVLHADAALNDVLTAFKKHYPFISIKDSDDDGMLTYQRFLREVGARGPTADFIWSSAMDLQEKLINDGYAQPYSSPEMSILPSWAHWQDLGYGVTLEPIAFIYNSRFMARRDMPQTHAGLRSLLKAQEKKLRGRIAMYDPEKSEVGMLLLSQDVRVTRDTWNLLDTIGDLDAKVYGTSRDMLTHIISGDQWIGYDVIASYAVDIQRDHPELVIVYPTDYVLTLSRVAFITVNAKHPNAARLFLDFLLSKEGQTIFLNHGMGSVRADVGVPRDQSRLSSIRTQAIRIGPGLLSDLDGLVRNQFLRRWHHSRNLQ